MNDDGYVCLEMYQLQAYIQIIMDLGHTPYIAIDIRRTQRDFDIPLDANATSIILNVDPTAVSNWNVDYINGYLYFSVRFSGIKHNIMIPCEAVEGVYVRGERSLQFMTSNLLTFITNPGITPPNINDTTVTKPTEVPQKKKPSLTLVK